MIYSGNIKFCLGIADDSPLLSPEKYGWTDESELLFEHLDEYGIIEVHCALDSFLVIFEVEHVNLFNEAHDRAYLKLCELEASPPSRITKGA